MACSACDNKETKPNNIILKDVKKISETVPVKNMKIIIKKIN